MSRTKPQSLPHSWPINDWPAHVYPNRPSSGKYLVRAYRGELIKAGALTRIGRELVVLGEGYARFLAGRRERVEGYTIPPNAVGTAGEAA
jgi:hypothetical protein